MQRGLTAVEGLVAIVCLLVLAAVVLVVVDLPTPYMAPERTECMSNVRNLVGLLEMAPYPDHGGPDLVLYLVVKGELATEDHLSILFCPGDREESLAKVGGAPRFKSIRLGKPNGHLTSYAGRDLRDPRWKLEQPVKHTAVLVADDSEDHHDGKGIVVGLAGGSAKWRDKFDFYETDDPLVVGPGSAIEELRCLKVD